MLDGLVSVRLYAHHIAPHEVCRRGQNPTVVNVDAHDAGAQTDAVNVPVAGKGKEELEIRK